MGRFPEKVTRYFVPLGAVGCLTPQVPSAVALAIGAALAVTVGNPHVARTRQAASVLLSLSVIGLGAGMDLGVVGRVGLQGVTHTFVGIALTLALGTALGKLVRTPPVTSLLIAVGTAICGGSAIAAVAPTVSAKPQEISVALGVVFLLNAAALVIFPWVGRALAMDPHAFGLWSALAIHDTSSVVGATLPFGPEALEVGTSVKLARALWIVPVTLVLGRIASRGDGAPRAGKAKRPWFILGFLLAAAAVTWIPALRAPGQIVHEGAKRALVMTLFLIGANLTRDTLRGIGLRPLLQGLCLWALVACCTLGAVLTGLIR